MAKEEDMTARSAAENLVSTILAYQTLINHIDLPQTPKTADDMEIYMETVRKDIEQGRIGEYADLYSAFAAVVKTVSSQGVDIKLVETVETASSQGVNTTLAFMRPEVFEKGLHHKNKSLAGLFKDVANVRVANEYRKSKLEQMNKVAWAQCDMVEAIAAYQNNLAQKK